jgi:hypothetical protein
LLSKRKRWKIVCNKRGSIRLLAARETNAIDLDDVQNAMGYTRWSASAAVNSLKRAQILNKFMSKIGKFALYFAGGFNLVGKRSAKPPRLRKHARLRYVPQCSAQGCAPIDRLRRHHLRNRGLRLRIELTRAQFCDQARRLRR